MKMLIRLLITCAVLFLIVWGVALVSRKNSPLTGEVTNDPKIVARGEQVAIAGDCQACHTNRGGEPFAGGLPFPIPKLGTIYSPNITPDKDTGIGKWTLAEFDRAVRYGVSGRLGNLYPAMPYPSYSKISDDDMRALYAYFQFGVKATKSEDQVSHIPFPLNTRWPVQLWNIAFAPTKTYQPVEGQREAWNRGAYLAQGLAHCGTCHTPRSELTMNEIAYDQTKKGYLSGGMPLGGWQAFNITPDANSGIGSWSEEDIATFLKTGHVAGKAQAAGQMAEAVTNSFSKMPQADLAAIATYIKTIPAVSDDQAKQRSSYGAPAQVVAERRGVEVPPESGGPTKQPIDPHRIFLGACASCHGVDGGGQFNYYPSLFHNSATGAKSANNLVQVIANGLTRQSHDNYVYMPGFREVLSPAEITALANFILQQFGNPETQLTEQQVQDIIKQLPVTDSGVGDFPVQN